MNQATAISLNAADSLFRNVRLEGFTSRELEELRAMLSRIPPQLLQWTKSILAQELGAKHGRYLQDSQTVLVNPKTFRNRVMYGKGPGAIRTIELVVAHEIGHSIYDNLPLPVIEDWLLLGNWVIGSDTGNAPPYVEKRPGWPIYVSDWTHAASLVMPRKYSNKSPEECFADVLAFSLLGKSAQCSPELVGYIQNLINALITKYPSPLYLGGVTK